MKFVDEVKSLEAKKTEKYDVNLFGGEPLLNWECVQIVLDGFKDEPRAAMNLITNGDLIGEHMYPFLDGCNVFISAYDAFDPNRFERYKEIRNRLKRCVFLFTVSEDNLDRIDELEDLFGTNGLELHIHFSHDPNSWKNMDVGVLKTKIKDIFATRLKRYSQSYSNSNPRAPYLLDSHLTRYIQTCAVDSDEHLYCTTQEKKTFMDGRFIGPCIRLKDKELSYKESLCSKCRFDRCCTRGCFAEIDGEVDSHLCAIEMARFEAIEDFIKSKPENLGKILWTYGDLMIQIRD